MFIDEFYVRPESRDGARDAPAHEQGQWRDEPS
jgi:hypothetical protein